jgi:glycosyltransferase involved in cell wall biosynthesis
MTSVLLRRRFIKPLYSDAEVVFPMLGMYRENFRRIPQHLYWIPDFQEHYLPQFFTQEEVVKRKADQQLIQQWTQHIVFSSESAKHDFNAIYPQNKLQQYVLQFAVTSQLDDEPVGTCLARYDIKQSYFICSNQFWKHKNHQIVLRALAGLKRTHPHALVLFTGKEHDYRNPTYFEELKVLQENLGLTTEIRFLGFIPRQDQLHLMQGSIAVIQPSLFEGWSTVVEDAKSLSVPVIASNLAVHTEQLTHYDAKLYFEPASTEELRACMAQAMDESIAAPRYDYQQDIINFARNFTKIIAQVTAE